MEQVLRDAIAAVHAPDAWVHLATIGPDGEPHVTPMMMGLHEDGLLFSMTGKQKKRNIERDPRACVAISKPVSMAHVIVWGTIEMRHDDEAHRWEHHGTVLDERVARAVWGSLTEHFDNSNLRWRT